MAKEFKITYDERLTSLLLHDRLYDDDEGIYLFLVAMPRLYGSTNIEHVFL